MLQLAEQHDLTLVENDIYVDLDPRARPSLASLDQLQRVIYIGSFSKTISPNIRVGYLLRRPDLLDELAQLKMLSGLTSSELTERLAYGALSEGRWRKHLKGCASAWRKRTRWARRLLELGFELFHEPKAGMYLWARHPDIASGAELSQGGGARHHARPGPSVLHRPGAQPLAAVQRRLLHRRRGIFLSRERVPPGAMNRAEPAR